MPMIDADGLFGGERLAACSDLAQLYWPRMYLASNGYGRLELSYTELSRKLFSSFKKPPTEDVLWNVVEEFVHNFLAVVYQVEGGSWWLQFATSEKFLPRYKTARDERSPAPPLILVEKQREGYIAWKKAKSLPNQRFQKFAENCGEFQKVSAVVVVEGVVEGVVEKVEEKDSKTLLDKSSARFDNSLIYECYPRKVGRKKALEAIDAAVKRLVKGEPPLRPMKIPEAHRFLRERVSQYASSAAGQQGKYTPHPSTWFAQSRYLDEQTEWEVNKEQSAKPLIYPENRNQRIVREALENLDKKAQAALRKIEGLPELFGRCDTAAPAEIAAVARKHGILHECQIDEADLIDAIVSDRDVRRQVNRPAVLTGAVQ